MTARPPDLEGDASDDFADHAWAMLMARLNNDRSPKLHKEVHCTLIVRESTIKCAAKVRGGNALDARASLPAKPFGGYGATEPRDCCLVSKAATIRRPGSKGLASSC